MLLPRETSMLCASSSQLDFCFCQSIRTSCLHAFPQSLYLPNCKVILLFHFGLEPDFRMWSGCYVCFEFLSDFRTCACACAHVCQVWWWGLSPLHSWLRVFPGISKFIPCLPSLSHSTNIVFKTLSPNCSKC